VGAKALVKVEYLGYVTPEDHVHHLEFLFLLAATTASAVDTRVKLNQLTSEVVAGRTGIHEAEVHADDLAGRTAVLVDESGGRRVDWLPRVINVTATRELLAKQPVLPA